MARNRILIVEDEVGVRFGIRDFLESRGFDVDEADTCKMAQEAFRANRPDVALIDYRLPDGNALELLPRLKSMDAGVPIIILTAHGTIDLAVQAIKEGAEQFFTKPIELPVLLVVVQRQIEIARELQKQQVGRKKQARDIVDPFVGDSPAIRQLHEDVRRIVVSESPILLQGETGAGKGVLARWLHANGPRGDESFVDLNCAGLSREFLETELFGHEKGAFTGAIAAKAGLLEVAHRGTVFLDEIGDVDLQLQPKLLKVLEEKQFRRLGDVRDRRVDIRLITASHQDLPRLVHEKLFRSDLYFRISTIPLVVPALRHRQEDIPVLARRLLEGIARDLGRALLTLSTETVTALQSYPWPGNIRELRNVLERAFLLTDRTELLPRDIRFDLPIPPDSYLNDSGLTLEEMEKRHIERILQEERGRVESAARRLGIPRSSLYQKIKKFQLSLSKF